MLLHALQVYESETRALAKTPGVTEETYYPHIRQLISTAMTALQLPFEVRTGTSERRPSKGWDRPDFVVADGAQIAAYGEAKSPEADLADLAVSVDRDNQIGRYLARTGIVLICNVRSLGIVLCRPGTQRHGLDCIAPEDRELVRVAALWTQDAGIAPERAATQTLELLETALLDAAPIAEPATLARVLALQAKAARDALPSDLRRLETLLEDYRDALGLSFDLDEEEGRDFFRSTLIQTAFYGLFAAWALWQRDPDGETFSWDRVNRYLRIPFLAGLFHEFRNPSRLQHLGLERHLDRATETLNRVDLEIFRQRMTFPSLADGDVASAAMTYFYEPFLEAFDPALKKSMGVWYTPPEIVRYQVRRAHELLKTQLGRPLGLADENVVLLDPCCGTGAYLLEAARCIAAELRQQGEEAVVGLSLLRALTTRIIGFEVLTAPFAIAQLQLYVLLSDLRAPPPNDQRLGVFLTNALTGWQDRRQLRLNFPELQLEFDAAQAIKHDADIVVVIGNPPYDRYSSIRMEEEAGLVDHYKGLSYTDRQGKEGRKAVSSGASLLFRQWGVRKQLLNDLYIRFYRLAEREIGEEREFGLVSLITNSSWLTGRSHPIMRESLLRNFHEVWIDNLNGDKYRTGKVIPTGLPNAGQADQSVFTTETDARGIQTGVAIGTFLKRGDHTTTPEDTIVHYRDFWGRAAVKRRQLNGVDHAPEYLRLTPRRQNRWRLAPHEEVAGYEGWPSLDELFPTKIQGVNPNRGLSGSVVDTDRATLAARIRAYITADTFEVAARLCPTLAAPRAGYDPQQIWRELKELGFDEARVRPYLLFPLDGRWIYYEERTKLLNRAREALNTELREDGYLIAVPEPRKVSEAKPLFATTLLDLHVHDRGSVAIPPVVHAGTIDGVPTANLAPQLWSSIRNAWGLSGDLRSEAAQTTARQLVMICLAALHSPAYAAEHASALGADWARVPVPTEPAVAAEMAHLGAQVATLLDPEADAAHVLQSILPVETLRSAGSVQRRDGQSLAPEDLRVTISYFGAAPGRFVVGPDGVGDLWINPDVSFTNIPVAAWRYELGGYPVIKKWLGYRHEQRNDGRPLTLDDQRWLRQMVQRLTALQSLGPALDAIYSQAAAQSLIVVTDEASLITAAE